MIKTLRIAVACALVSIVALQSLARAQTVVWSDDFEDGHAQWSTTGFWHWIRDTNDCAGIALPFPSGTHVMWYGIDGQCNFDNGLTNGGTLLMLPHVTLPATGQTATLRYKWLRLAEACGPAIGQPYDWSQVTVHQSVGASIGMTECLVTSSWRKGRIDVTPQMGHDVWVDFRLDTQDEEQNGGLGWMIDDVVIQLESGRSYCEFPNCPCSNPTNNAFHSHSGGCLNSWSVTEGAELFGGGTPSVATDDVTLTIEGMPPTSFVTFLQGDVLAGNGVVFGDGLRCIGGSLIRIGTKAAVDGIASYPGELDLPLSVKGMIPPGGMTVGYQGHYRDNGVFCTSANFNLSNGYKVAWVP